MRNRPRMPKELLRLAGMCSENACNRFTVSRCHDHGSNTLHFRFYDEDEPPPSSSSRFVNRCTERRYPTLSDVHGNVWVDPKKEED